MLSTNSSSLSFSDSDKGRGFLLRRVMSMPISMVRWCWWLLAARVRADVDVERCAAGAAGAATL